MSLRRELLKAALLAAALLVLLPAAAMAIPQWLGAERLDPALGSGGQPDVATDAAGNSAAVWIGTAGVVNAAIRDRGGPWGPPENLEPGDQVQREDDPLVIAEPDGEFVAVWVGNVGGSLGDYVRWARKPPGQDWSAPDSIVRATAGNPTLKALEVGAAGDVTVLWTQGIEGTNANTNTKPAGSESWESADFVNNASGDHFALATAPDGSAVIAYPDQCGITFFLNCVRAEYRPKGGDWSRAPELAGVGSGQGHGRRAGRPAGLVVHGRVGRGRPPDRAEPPRPGRQRRSRAGLGPVLVSAGGHGARAQRRPGLPVRHAWLHRSRRPWRPARRRVAAGW